MQTRHNFNALAMELHLPCIKPPKLYVNSSDRWKHMSMYKVWLQKWHQGRKKKGYVSFLGTPTLSKATEQAVVAGRACGCHIGTTN